MVRNINFSAGPAALPEVVLSQVQWELLDWKDTGASVMELSHRGRHFMDLADQMEQDLRTLMAIPDQYAVLFLSGGARAQFAAIPLNLDCGGAADYLVSGHWSKLALNEARKFIDASEVMSCGQSPPYTITSPENWQLSPQASYLHYTPNETLTGLEFGFVPRSGQVPLVADMSSCILSEPVDINRFGVIYACAQKNIGPAGLTVVIINRDLIRAHAAAIPSVIDYGAQLERGSMLNTPSTFAWYVASLVIKWLLDNGGLAVAATQSRKKAAILYDVIDGSSGLYVNQVEPRYRSKTNVCFRLPDDISENRFVTLARSHGMIGLQGHAAAGGLRASIYNATPEAAVNQLADFMKEFERTSA